MGTRVRLCGQLEVELDGQRVEQRLPGRQGPLRQKAAEEPLRECS